MKQNVMKKWVKALLSGKYKQGRGLLKQQDKNKISYCCLGVLCEIYNEDMRKNKKKILTEQTAHTILSYDNMRYKIGGQTEKPPKIVREWAGLNSNFGDFVIEDGESSLAGMNDEGKTFKTIAKTIEEVWEIL